MKLFGLELGKKATAGEKQRAYAVAKAQLVEPTEECVRFAQAAVAQIPESRLAQAAQQKDVISHILENPQDDLQYFKAVYATCGFNLNDDVFVRAEFWNARKSPVLKPANWQHKDSDILGVIYAVEAQTLNGVPLDIESEKVPEEDFELIVHGVVYKYTFAEYAEEIQKRSKAGELYVSMETWFSDFAYALLNEDNKTIDVVDRTEGTESLDKTLRCFGGPGKYNGKRIGRVLKGLTFGGMGFVDQPANPRSDGLVYASSEDTNRVEEIPHENQKMEIDMHDETKVREAVAAELNERAKADKLVELQAKVETLETEKAQAAENAERAAQKAEEDALALALIGEALDEAIAGLGDNAPAEIAKIDNAGVGGEFAAKIAFLAATAAKTDDEAAQAELEELRKFKADTEAEKAEAEKAARAEARKAEVQEILGESADEESVDKILAGLADLDDEAYAARIEEFKVIAGSRPGLMKDGGQGSAEEEGKSGESHAKSGPRHKISVAESLENAEVEETIEPTGGDEVIDSPFQGLASQVGLSKTNKE